MFSIQRSVYYLTLSAGVIAFSGCSDQASQRLIGTWEGHAEGSQESQALDKAEAGDSPDEDRERPGESNSLLSQYAFSITLDFVDSNSVRMSVAGGEDDLPPGSQPIPGQWSVIEADKNRMTIQIQTPHQESEAAPHRQDSSAVEVSQTTKGDSEPETRRFILRWQEDDKDRFTLSEEGGAPHLGSLVFRRVEK